MCGGVGCDQGKTVYVADTNNHAIRKIDMVERTVTTLVGNGEQGVWRASQHSRPGPVARCQLTDDVPASPLWLLAVQATTTLAATLGVTST